MTDPRLLFALVPVYTKRVAENKFRIACISKKKNNKGDEIKPEIYIAFVLSVW